jgi:hypothetical protein
VNVHFIKSHTARVAERPSFQNYSLKTIARF